MVARQRCAPAKDEVLRGKTKNPGRCPHQTCPKSVSPCASVWLTPRMWRILEVEIPVQVRPDFQERRSTFGFCDALVSEIPIFWRKIIFQQLSTTMEGSNWKEYWGPLARQILSNRRDLRRMRIAHHFLSPGKLCNNSLVANRIAKLCRANQNC